MNDILLFLRELACNNNKEWFTANKKRYQDVLAMWYAFCEELIVAIGQYDPDIAKLTTFNDYINRAVDYRYEYR